MLNTGTYRVLSDLIGAAIKEGGTTVSVSTYRDTKPVTSGYVVGGFGVSLVIPRYDSDDLGVYVPAPSRDAAIFWIDRNLNKHERVNFGSWRDDRGRIWLDRVNILDNLDDALFLARFRGELAIFHLDTGEEIAV